MPVISKFQEHCQNLVSKLTEDTKIIFKSLLTDIDRVKFLYSIANQDKIELSTWSPKDVERAESLKSSGNKLFQHRNFFHAINIYNEAILRCPQDYIDGQKLHDVLIGNRSAVFFELKEYQKVIKDVEFLYKFGHHPFIYKISFRAGKACEAIKQNLSALKYYKNARKQLEETKEINENERAKAFKDIESRIKDLENKKLKNEKLNEEKSVQKVENKNITYPALTAKIIVKNSIELGRYVVAKEDIRAGEIIAIEEPYVSVVTKDSFRTNCSNCLKSINQLISCEFCSQACFCSFDCKNSATFHTYECKILLTLFDAGVSVNCLMALRMITQKSLLNLKEEMEELNKERNVVIYKTDDIFNVYNLVSHADRRDYNEFIHYTFMATYLLRLLKMTNYFEISSKDEVLTEDEAFIGSLILKNLQILQFNAHEIAELQYNLNSGKDDVKYLSETIGAGLYTTCALFNHSCDPSIIRYNVGNAMVLRAVKPIKRNEGVYENYGPLYTNDLREERIEKLRKLYWFDCQCLPCTEDWPLYKDIDTQTLRISCECGNVLLAEKDIEDPTLRCAKCKKEKLILGILAGLIPVGAKSSQAEKLFCKSLYNEAMPLYIEMLELYAKYLVPPISDMIMLQQRLKTCLVHCGNKKFDYKIN